MKAIVHVLRRIGLSRLLGLVLLAGLLALRIADPAPVAQARNLAFDAFQRLHPREVPVLPVSIVDIDDASLEEIGQWPWPRTRIAELIDKMTVQGAAAIAFDVVFAEPDRLSPAAVALDNPDLPPDVLRALSALPDNDDVLAAAFAGSRVVAGQASVRRDGPPGARPPPPPPRRDDGPDDLDGDTGDDATPAPSGRQIPDVAHAFLGPDPTRFMERFPDMVQNLPQIEAAAAGHGVFAVRPDPDGIYRRLPLVMMVGGKIRLGLAPELLRVATGGDAFAVKSNAAGIDGVVLARQLIRTDERGRVWPHFSHPAPGRFVSAADVLAGRLPQGRLAGQLVLVGTSATGINDFRATPMGGTMPGVEIHAQLLENILSQSLLVRPNYAIAVELAAAALLGLLVIGLVPLLGAGWMMLATGALLTGYVGLTWLAFDTRRLLLDPAFPFFAAGATVIFMAGASYLREERQRRQIRGAFGQYVSPTLVDQLSRHPDRLVLGGETRALSVLFCDLRDFTGLSESLRDDPAALTQLINRFLTVLSDAVLAEGGTIDKFMGDAVMAFWNAPLDHPDHALAACRAARLMTARAEDLNRALAAEAEAATGQTPALPQVRLGIGINTGAAVVGNMGSAMRFDYTALGDTVNLASRLEGLSKSYGFDVILGPETAAAATAGGLALIEVDLVRVKGKSAPARVYALLGDAALRERAGFAAMVAANDAMLAGFRAADPDAADAAADRMSAEAATAGMTADTYLTLYRDRIAGLRASPPAPDWDGASDAAKG